MVDTDVLIVGAGPVGLTLAVDLGLRGVRCTLVEQKEAPQFLPKMERCNARTMEIYRRMGIAERVRAAGLPAHCPMDVFIVLSLVEPPLVRLPYPSVKEAKAEIASRPRCPLPSGSRADGPMGSSTIASSVNTASHASLSLAMTASRDRRPASWAGCLVAGCLVSVMRSPSPACRN